MDIVYVLRQGENRELRYSLRTLCEFFPHDKVWTVGGIRPWLKDVQRVKTYHTKKSKWQNAVSNLKTACQQDDLSDDFVLMNDDFFFLQPMQEIPVYHRGYVEDVMKKYPNSKYGKHMQQAYEYFKSLGFEEPLSYELHVPFIYNKHKLAKILDDLSLNKIHITANIRSLYGNMYDVGGTQIRDCKIEDKKTLPEKDWQFLSTSDTSFKDGTVGKWIRNKFPHKSWYEK